MTKLKKKTQIVRKNLKLWELKLWQNSKTQFVTKPKKFKCDKTIIKTQIVTKLKKSNCDKTQKLKLWQYSKTRIVTKLKN